MGVLQAAWPWAGAPALVLGCALGRWSNLYEPARHSSVHSMVRCSLPARRSRCPRELRVSCAPVPGSTGLTLGWDGACRGCWPSRWSRPVQQGPAPPGNVGWGALFREGLCPRAPPRLTALPRATTLRSACACLGPVQGNGACCPLASAPAAGRTGPRVAQSPV